jgi:hypothetical protein
MASSTANASQKIVTRQLSFNSSFRFRFIALAHESEHDGGVHVILHRRVLALQRLRVRG